VFKSLNSNLACRHLWKQQSNKKVAATYSTNQMSKCLPQWWFIAFNVETTFYKMFRKNVASRNFSGLTIARLINSQTTDKIACWQTDERLTDTEQTFRLSAKARKTIWRKWSSLQRYEILTDTGERLTDLQRQDRLTGERLTDTRQA